jgi:hypothetical protein
MAAHALRTKDAPEVDDKRFDEVVQELPARLIADAVNDGDAPVGPGRLRRAGR